MPEIPRSTSLIGTRLVWIVLAFLVTRLVVLALFSPEIHIGDQAQYVRVAESILQHGFSGYLDPGFVIQKGSYYPYFSQDIALPDGEYNPIFWDPLYPLFVSLTYALFGVSNAMVRMLQLMLSLLTLLIGMDAVRRMFPNHTRAPEWFGWMFVAYLPFAGFVTKILGETLDAFLLTCIVWMATRLPRSAPRAFLAFGALLGLYTSIRSYWFQLIPFLLLLLAWLLARTSDRPVGRRGCILRVALAGVGVFLVLTPTYLRNHQISGGSWLVSTKGGWNLWKDNNNLRIVNHDWREPISRVHLWLKAYYALGAADRVPTTLESVYYDASRPLVRPPCDVTLDRLYACERNFAIAFLFESPLRFAVRAFQKNANLWSPNNYIFNRAPPGHFTWNQNYRAEIPGALRYLLQIWVIGCYLLAMLLFFVGISIPAESEAQRFVRALLALSLGFLVFVVVPWGHGVTRFRLPFMVPILMFSVRGLAGARDVGWSPIASGPDRWARALRSGLAAWLLAICAVKLPLLLAP